MQRQSFLSAWKGALACFVLAGMAGVLFRWGIVASLPEGWQFGNVRHAHSHLMYFGWVTPAIMALIASHMRDSGHAGRVIHATLGLAVLSFVPFLLYGYGPAQIGGMRLPLSVMLAGGNMLAWYAFVAVYVRQRNGISDGWARRFWDAALAFLVLASLGAWGLGIVQALKPESPFWFAAALHLFLDLFADGWLLMAVLGFACATIESGNSSALRWGFVALVAGLPVTFLLGVPVDLVPGGLRWLGGGGGIIAGLGLGSVAAALWRNASPRMRRIWLIPLVLIGVKVVAQIGLSVPAAAEWTYDMSLRILYLHILLLGIVTLGLVAAARCVWGTRITPGRALLTASVLVLLMTLLPLTRLWPVMWMGGWTRYAALIGAIGPVLAMAHMLGRLLWTPEREPRPAENR